MKLHLGSLQKRGNRYYLVIRRDSRQKWIALKTGKLALARVRASKIAPRDPEDELSWLEQLVREGESARKSLARISASRELTWDNLDDFCRDTVDLSASPENRTSHCRWLRLLACLAIADKSGQVPSSLTSDTAKRIVKNLSANYISASRMVAYYRRVWSAAGLDPDIWPRPERLSCDLEGKNSEHYRRLSRDELIRLYARACEVSRPLADMFLLGYSTGLRLSDVAELELSEIDLPFLRVCPNKTRRHKPFPLKIPLTDEALEVAGELRLSAIEQGRNFLFDERFRHRPSRKFSAIFRACDVVKSGVSRASFHSLRATFISMMDDAGIPPHITDSITGHGGGGMHARYTQPSDEALLSAVARAIPPLCSPAVTLP